MATQTGIEQVESFASHLAVLLEHLPFTEEDRADSGDKGATWIAGFFANCGFHDASEQVEKWWREVSR